jgi:hypothetical protein
MFSNNTAEQGRYYITNILKKPQRISICQFVQRVDQHNSYIMQLLLSVAANKAQGKQWQCVAPFTLW